jgi:peptide deformylase
MILPIVCYPANVLRARCKPIAQVTEQTRKLAQDMIETMHHAHGVGLAAPQIGIDEQIAVIDVSHNPQCVTGYGGSYADHLSQSTSRAAGEG